MPEWTVYNLNIPMKSPEFITHGTASDKDAKKIIEEGFLAQEGRATVSSNLIYAFSWATQQEKRRGSKSESEINGDETGRIIILKTPEDRDVGRATHTDVSVDDETKEVTGYSLKYVSGRKQLGIYPAGDSIDKRDYIETVKQDVATVYQELKTYLEDVGVYLGNINSEDDLVAATDHFDVAQQVEIIDTVASYIDRLSVLRQEAEVPVDIPRENILMSIVPSLELGEKLERLKREIYALETIDLDAYASELAATIETDEENSVAAGTDVEKALRTLLTTTVEAEVMAMVRSLAMDVKRAQGYAVFNRGNEDLVEKHVDREALKSKLESVKRKVESEDFDIGVENLNRYIRMNLKRMLDELQ